MYRSRAQDGITPVPGPAERAWPPRVPAPRHTALSSQWPRYRPLGGCCPMPVPNLPALTLAEKDVVDRYPAGGRPAGRPDQPEFPDQPPSEHPRPRAGRAGAGVRGTVAAGGHPHDARAGPGGSCTSPPSPMRCWPSRRRTARRAGDGAPRHLPKPSQTADRHRTLRRGRGSGRWWARRYRHGDEHGAIAADLVDGGAARTWRTPSAMLFMPWMYASPSWPPCGLGAARRSRPARSRRRG